MILSVSRRTDIPNYYADWFYERIKEGYAYAANPHSPSMVSRIDLSPEVVDCIVFWTKNPEPMLRRLPELAAYRYYFQFTLTGYGRDLEPGIPDKWSHMIPVFRKLAGRMCEKGVVWRYDPIIFTNWHTPEWHLKTFRCMAEKLCGYTDRVVVGFLDDYVKIRKKMAQFPLIKLPEDEIRSFAGSLSEIAAEYGMRMYSCAERMDLTDAGIAHGSCIDARLIEQIVGCKMELARDKYQRPECGCMESVDIGAYHTCGNGCAYCYAGGPGAGGEKTPVCDVCSPILCRELPEDAKITVKRVKSQKREQMHLKDFMDYYLF